MKKLLYFLSLFVVCCLLFVAPAHAAQEFESHYFIDYQVFPSGQTEVSQEVRLKNRLKNVYATEYSLTIGSTQITNIAARDDKETLGTKIEKGQNSTTITIFLKQKVLGKDKEQSFFLSYQTPDFAYIKGNILEVGIPLLSQTEDINTYEITLKTPVEFGEATNILPQAPNSKQQGGYYLYLFNKTDLEKVEGIRAIFGSEQIFKFSLKYHLKNPGAVPIKTQIALPPDTPFQKLSYQKIEPAPEDVERDADGNWLAVYKLDKQEQIDILALGFAKISLTPDLERSVLGEFQDRPFREKYLASQRFWETESPEIKKLAEQLRTPEAIYDYVAKNFIYDYGRAESGQLSRLGAQKALESPGNAICMEFADTFIALARAAGLPAREVNGFAYTTNPMLRPLSLDRDVLHAWPEYLNEKQNLWIPIDPTWANTTGGLDFFEKRDLDHFAFVFHGLSSEEPLPAGSYKLDGTAEKDINIEFAERFTEKQESKLELLAPLEITAGSAEKANIKIQNTGTTAIYGQTLNILLEESSGHKSWQKQEKIFSLPPFARETVDLKLSLPLLFKNDKATLSLTAKFADQSVKKKIELKPLVSLNLVKWGIGIIIGFFFAFITIKVGYAIAKKTNSKNKKSS